MEIEHSNTMCYNSNTLIIEGNDMETATISVRTDKDLKNEAEKVFNDLGINFSTAINVFLKKVVATQSIPFDLKVEKPNKKTEKVLKAVDEYIKTGKGKKNFTSYESIDDFKKKIGK